MIISNLKKKINEHFIILEKYEHEERNTIMQENPKEDEDNQIESNEPIEDKSSRLSPSNQSIFIAEVIPYDQSQYKEYPNHKNIQYIEISRGWIVHETWEHEKQEGNVYKHDH